MTQKIETDVVIVGAGLSGLATAEKLRDSGTRVVMLEARPSPGGRIERMESEGLDRAYDAGATYVFDTEEQILELFARHNIETEAISPEGNLVSHLDGTRRVVNPTQPFDDDEAMSAFVAAMGKLGEMAATVRSGHPWEAPNALEWDSQTFRSWLLANIPNDEARFAVQSQLANPLGGNPQQLSLLAILDFMQSTGDGGLPEEFRIARGGLFRLTESMAEGVGDSLILDSPVRSISQTGDHVTAISDRAEVKARAAVLALSPGLVDRIEFTPKLSLRRKLLSRRWLEVPGTKAVLVYDRPFWREAGLSGMSVADLPAVNFTLDTTERDQEQGVLVAFYGATERADWELLENPQLCEQAMLESLVKMFGPEAASPRAILSRSWVDDDWSAGCGFGLFPGVWTQYGPALREPHGRVHFAGTDTAELFQGSVEGAVRSGQHAARQIVRLLDNRGSDDRDADIASIGARP